MGDTVSIIGYHKEPDKNTSDILRNNRIKVSQDKEYKDTYMWLGAGIYFWHTFEDAIWWNNNRYHYGAVFSALLSCDSDKYVNLDLQEEMTRIAEYSDRAIADLKAKKAEIDFDNIDKVRSVLCTMYKYEKGIKLMRYSFPSRMETNSAGFYAPVRGRTQYCATDMESVSNIQLVARTEWDTIIGVYYGYV